MLRALEAGSILETSSLWHLTRVTKPAFALRRDYVSDTGAGEFVSLCLTPLQGSAMHYTTRVWAPAPALLQRKAQTLEAEAAACEALVF